MEHKSELRRAPTLHTSGTIPTLGYHGNKERISHFVNVDCIQKALVLEEKANSLLSVRRMGLRLVAWRARRYDLYDPTILRIPTDLLVR